MNITSMKNIHCNVGNIKPLTCKLNTAVNSSCRIIGTRLQDSIRDRFLLRVFNGWSFPALFFLSEDPSSGTQTLINCVQNIYPEIIFNILAGSESLKAVDNQVYPVSDISHVYRGKDNNTFYKKLQLQTLYQIKTINNFWERHLPFFNQAEITKVNGLIRNYTSFGLELADKKNLSAPKILRVAGEETLPVSKIPISGMAGLSVVKILSSSNYLKKSEQIFSRIMAGRQMPETYKMEYSSYGKSIGGNKEGFIEGYGPMNQATAGLEYKGAAPGTVPGSIRNIFRPGYQRQGPQLAEQLVWNVFKTLTEKRLARYLTAKERFEKAVVENPFFKHTEKRGKNGLLESYESFKLGFSDTQKIWLPPSTGRGWPGVPAARSEIGEIGLVTPPGKARDGGSGKGPSDEGGFPVALMLPESMQRKLYFSTGVKDLPDANISRIDVKDFPSVLKKPVSEKEYPPVGKTALSGKEYLPFLKTLVLEKKYLPILKIALSRKENSSVLKKLVGIKYLTDGKTLLSEKEYLSIQKVPAAGKETLPVRKKPTAGKETLSVLKAPRGLDFLRIAEKIITRVMTGKQRSETNKKESFGFGLSREINYADIPIHPFAAHTGDIEDILQPFGNIAQLQKSIPQPFGNIAQLHEDILQPFGNMAQLQKSISQPFGNVAQLQKSMPQPFGNIAQLQKSIPTIPAVASKSGEWVADKRKQQDDQQLWQRGLVVNPRNLVDSSTRPSYGKPIGGNKEGFIEGYGPVNQATADLEYKGAAPGTVPGSIRNIFRPGYQRQGPQLAEQLVWNVFKTLTEKRLARYLAAKERFERAVVENPFFKHTERGKNGLLQSYESFKEELADIRNPLKAIIPGINGEGFPPVMKIPATGMQYLSALNMPGSSNLWRIAEKVFAGIMETRKNLEVHKREYSRIQERENKTQLRRTQNTLINTNREDIIKQSKNKQSILKYLQNKEYLVLSGKINYQDRGAGKMELIIPTPPFAAQDYSSGYARNMPPITYKSSERVSEKQRELVVKSLNTPTDSQTGTIKKSVSGMDLSNPSELNKLVDKVYSQLEAKLAWERRRFGY